MDYQLVLNAIEEVRSNFNNVGQSFTNDNYDVHVKGSIHTDKTNKEYILISYELVIKQ